MARSILLQVQLGQVKEQRGIIREASNGRLQQTPGLLILTL